MTERSEHGTGKHAHKDSQESRPHAEGEEHGRQQSRAEGSGKEAGRQSGATKGEKSHEQDLKEREYRDKQGNVHHHTHTSSEYKEKERKAG